MICELLEPWYRQVFADLIRHNQVRRGARLNSFVLTYVR